MKQDLTFAHLSIDRASDKRTCNDWYKSQSRDESRLLIPFYQGKALFIDNGLLKIKGDEPWLLEQRLTASDELAENQIFLGNDTGTAVPVFMIELSEDAFLSLNCKYQESIELVGTRQCIPYLSKEEVSLIGYAAALNHWHQSARFCGYCGETTRLIESGHAKQCSNVDCNKLHFPRKDPVVIALVEHTDSKGVKRCLLAGHKHLPSCVISTLAGFVEHGESVEQAVVREVYEETQIAIDNVQYLNSQPWPFPNSLMLGFIAQAQTQEIVIDEQELSSADWFTADEVKLMKDWHGEMDSECDGWKIPRKESIARYLIEYWLASVQSNA
ncbi:NAD(+) diphosphatase [Thalassotalea fusca]